MAVDLHIGTIQARVTGPAADLLRDEAFIARLTEAVRTALEAERRIESQRAADTAPRVKRRL
ncbi:hypothetical protein GCM10009715_10610 [Paeniglutamicibacter psychrophenolicus]|uniref:DUF222 domain-containing protein n=1 Tax=Paeniglutamicibacter psychrophenolicus TaxID=257454 RepID=A0ABS4WGK3_9MICC|nr:hypothetical protein [Paeniglutamicibacter psychrophenolicus]MBP2375161.1 hypothetical protein [Paeniglutamicibacter psychrophenolicus]